MKKIKSDTVKQINKWLKEFSNTIQDNCDYYAFYRAKVYSNEDGIINIQFLCSNDKGMLKSPCLQYNSETGTLAYDYSGEKFNFRDEQVVINVIHNLVRHLSAFKQPVNRLLFDTCIYNGNITDAYVREDNIHKGEIIIYCVSAGHVSANYSINEATTSYGLELCSDWVSEARVDFQNFIEAGC